MIKQQTSHTRPIREISADRVQTVLTGEVPVPIRDEPGLLILHIVPSETTRDGALQVSIGDLDTELAALTPPFVSGVGGRPNFDGFLAYVAGGSEEPCLAYTQVFRNGLVEAVMPGMARIPGPGAEPVISVERMAQALLIYVTRLIPMLRRRGVTAPCAVMPILARVRGARFASTNPGSFPFGYSSFPSTRDLLQLVDQVVPETAHDDAQIRRAIKPVFDQLFQAAGMKGAPST